MEVESIEGSTELVWIDRSGRVLGGIAAPMAGLAEPALSPDGRRLAATAWTEGNRDVWIIDLERGSSSRLTFEDSHESVPMWDADTDRIIYSELRGMSSTIVSRAADGSGDRQELVQGAGYGMWGGLAAYSPDGRHLLFAVDEGGPKYLRLSEVGEDGVVSEPEPFFSSSPEPSILDARISPNGRLLAYMSTDSGQPEVFLTRFPEGTGRWQISNGGGSQPRWAKGNGELFFIGGSGPTSRMLTSVDLGTGPEIAIGVPEQLFSLSDNFNNSLKSEEGFDVAADGSRFLMVRSSSSGPASTPRMILVQNWREELPDR
jgi:dipeptidyl aminopeptidase/acylaminoacyl peptidase